MMSKRVVTKNWRECYRCGKFLATVQPLPSFMLIFVESVIRFCDPVYFDPVDFVVLLVILKSAV